MSNLPDVLYRAVRIAQESFPSRNPD